MSRGRQGKRDNPWPDSAPLLPIDTAREIAAGRTTARLNRLQRLALTLLLVKFDRGQDVRRRRHIENDEQRAEIKRLRIALDDMRQQRDAARKRAPAPPLACGKAPLRDEEEAHRFAALVCARTGELVRDYLAYPCPTCSPDAVYGPWWHIGHVVPAAQRRTDGLTARLGDHMIGDTPA